MKSAKKFLLTSSPTVAPKRLSERLSLPEVPSARDREKQSIQQSRLRMDMVRTPHVKARNSSAPVRPNVRSAR